MKKFNEQYDKEIEKIINEGIFSGIKNLASNFGHELVGKQVAHVKDKLGDFNADKSGTLGRLAGKAVKGIVKGGYNLAKNATSLYLTGKKWPTNDKKLKANPNEYSRTINLNLKSYGYKTLRLQINMFDQISDLNGETIENTKLELDTRYHATTDVNIQNGIIDLMSLINALCGTPTNRFKGFLNQDDVRIKYKIANKPKLHDKIVLENFVENYFKPLFKRQF